jgi:hypothetical protein
MEYLMESMRKLESVKSLDAIQVRTIDYLGERVQVRFPKAAKGPYQRRRQKRLDRDPRNWAFFGKGEYFIVENCEIWCHPDDLAKLRQALTVPQESRSQPAY